jgi:alpha-beta hydrolase superfamily lysophospholipase
MYNRSEGFFKGYQDINLFFQIWDNPKAKGTVIITHGHGEHSEWYSNLINYFSDDAWTFYGWDLRGHGRSEGRRGYAPEFDDYCRDYELFLNMVMKEEKVRKGPVILLCHSMGGLIQLKSLIRHPEIECAAIVVSSPLLGLSMPVPAWKAKGAGLLNAVAPQVTLGNEISNEMLSRDIDVLRQYEQDPLRHTRMSPGVFLGMLASCDYCNLRANEIKKPALFVLPEKDPVCNTPIARSFFDKMSSKQKEIYLYPDARHELFNDLNRNTVFADVKKFIDSFLE